MKLQGAFVVLLCVLAVLTAFFNAEALTLTMDLVLPGLGVYTVWVLPAFFGMALGSWLVLLGLGYLGQILVSRRLRRLEAEATQREAGVGAAEAALQGLRSELVQIREEMENLRSDLQGARSSSVPPD